VKSIRTKDTNCFSLTIDSDTGLYVTEYTVTEILVNERGCSKLENSRVIDEFGNPIPDYPNDCGTRDQLKWEVGDNIIGKLIKDQRLVLIKYDSSNKQIIVKA
jgi:hypothetical protein